MRWVAWAVLIPLAGLLTWQQLNSRHPPLPSYGRVPDFTLTNQLGEPVCLDSLHGQVWVADVIFTRCPSQCVHMTYEMNRLQNALPANKPIKLVSFTTDPKYDKPAVLKKYGQKCGAKENWIFLTGDKRVIAHVAVDGLKLSIVDKIPGVKEDPNDIFIHSTKFVLIDKRGEIRGYYIGETGEARPRLLADIEKLLRE